MSDEELPSDEIVDDENPVDLDPGLKAIPSDYVMLIDPPDFETSEILLATLAASGIHGVMENPVPSPADNTFPPLGISWSHAIWVSPDDFEAAQAVLAESQPTEEDLAAEQAADPTTLSEAERDVKNA